MNATVVTSPDFYFADAPSILCVGCDDYTSSILDNLSRVDVPVTVYLTTPESNLDWICSAYFQSEISILNCAYNDFLLGFLIDKEGVYYYNNKESYKRFNLNEVADPIEPLIKWISEWHINNQEKNARLE